MAKARKLKQLSFIIPNKAGLLSEVTTAISGARVNINSVCAYEMENNAYFMLAADSNAKAKKALTKRVAEIKEEDVVGVEMPNKAGELQKVAKRIADAGVNIYYVYGTAGTGKSSTCIFKTADDKKVIKLINK